MEKVFTGAARVGMTRVTWPLARLTVSPGQIRMTGVRGYFAPSDIVSIQAYGSTRWTQGIHIIHNRHDVPERVQFGSATDPQEVLQAISDAGFIPSGNAIDRPSGWPLRWWVAALLVVIWLPIFIVGNVPRGQPNPASPYICIALPLMLLGCIALRRSQRLQSIVLKPGHLIGEIDLTLRGLQWGLAILSAPALLVLGLRLYNALAGNR